MIVIFIYLKEKQELPSVRYQNKALSEFRLRSKRKKNNEKSNHLTAYKKSKNYYKMKQIKDEIKTINKSPIHIFPFSL